MCFVSWSFGFGQDYVPTSKERKSLGVQASKQTAAPKLTSISSSEPKFSSEIQIGVNDSYAYIGPTGHASAQGNLVGLHANYTYRPPNFIYGGLSLFWQQGSVHGDDVWRSLVDVRIEENIGYTWSREDVLISLFTGFGGRSLSHLVHVEHNDVGFDYLEWYIPIGVSALFDINSVCSGGLIVEWMPQIYPTVLISPLRGARWTLTTEVLNFHLASPFAFRMPSLPHFSFVLEPFIEVWRDGHTSAETKEGVVLHVPSNNYVFAGLSFSLKVLF